ncbi:MAG: DUF3987 domain-containing protein [Shimia thalassica]|uniref:DUF3987 domain-containing protein n=1 Tax=Shimia thalassica TaxID=1715693 RepID=UPI00329732E5
MTDALMRNMSHALDLCQSQAKLMTVSDFDAVVLREVLKDHAAETGFLVWRASATDTGGIDKVPCDPVTGLFTKPNAAKDRAVLTLDQVIEAAMKLRAEDIPCGIGAFAPRLGMAFVDADGCLDDGKIAGWAAPIAGKTYVEASPSGKGVRIVTNGIESDILAKYSNGHERSNLGLYGSLTSRFVTLTGRILPDSPRIIASLGYDAELAIMNRWTASVLNSAALRNEAFSGLYPAGRRGMEMAIEDIIDLTAIHPATIAFAAKAAHFMSREEAREALYIAYEEAGKTVAEIQNGTLRREQEARLAARFPKSIEGALEWVDSKGGWPKRHIPTQARQGAKNIVMQHNAEQEGKIVPPEPAPAATKDVQTLEEVLAVDPKANFIHWGDFNLSAEDELEAVRQRGRIVWTDSDGNFTDQIDVEEYEFLIEHLGGPLCEIPSDDLTEMRLTLLLDDGRPTPKKWDMHPLVKQQRGAERAATLVADAADLWQPVPAGPDFPDECLPHCITDVAAGMESQSGICRNMVANGMIAAASCVMAGGTSIRTKGFSVPPVLRGMSVTDAGQMKTSAAKVGLAGLRAAEADLKKIADRQRSVAYRNALEALGDADKAKKQAWAEVPAAPVLMVQTGTVQGIRDTLAPEAQQRRPVCLYTDELATYVARMKNGADGEEQRAHALEGYEGGPKVWVLASKGHGENRRADRIEVPEWLFGIFGNTQPDRWREIDQEMNLSRDGFIDRFMMIMPKRAVRSEGDDGSNRDDDDLPEEETDAQIAGLEHWQNVVVEVSRFDACQYGLSRGAARAHVNKVASLGKHADSLTKSGMHKSFAQFLNKTSGLLLRLALLLHVMKRSEETITEVQLGLRPYKFDRPCGPAPDPYVTQQTMEQAIQLYETWILPHAALFYHTMLMEGARGAAIQAVAGWLLLKDAEGVNQFKVRDLQRAGQTSLRHPFQQVRDIYEFLEVSGWMILDDKDYQGKPALVRTPVGISKRFDVELTRYEESVAWIAELKKSVE